MTIQRNGCIKKGFLGYAEYFLHFTEKIEKNPIPIGNIFLKKWIFLNFIFFQKVQNKEQSQRRKKPGVYPTTQLDYKIYSQQIKLIY